MLILISLTKVITFVIFVNFVLTVVSVNDCGCDRIFKPVCGSDEITYENLCSLTCEQRLRPALKHAYSGTCCPKAEFCTTFSDPICDNLGETHENECIFSYKQCVAKRSHNFILKVEKRGSCNLKNEEIIKRPPLDCNFYCDESEELVCDNMGHTHKNLCKFELAKCRRINRGLEAPEIFKTGECGKVLGHPIRRTQSIISTTSTATPSALKAGRIWNFGTFAPPPPVSFVDTTTSAIDIDSYGFGPASPTSGKAIETSSTKINLSPSTAYQTIPEATSAITEAGTFPPSLQPESTFTSPSPSPASSTLLVSTSSEPSLFKNCITCESEVDQVPICDNLNQTHKSICIFAQWNCKRRMTGLEERVLVHVGNCTSQSPLFSMEEEVCPSKCSKHYKPVCDTNGMTHPNLCTFQMFNCQQRKSGNINVAWLLILQECPSSPSSSTAPTIPRKDNSFDCPIPQCPSDVNEDSQICDNEGNTHANDCEFAHARCLAAKRGVILRILPEESCTKNFICSNATEEICTTEVDPICATDFITYPNMCHFRKAQCKNQEEIEILFKGDCKKCLNIPCPIVDPSNASLNDSIFLCDQNGETKSKCEFEMLRCIYEIKFGYNITEAYDGRCCSRDELCPMEHRTVCASNGQHYRNACYFNVSKCRAEKIEHELLIEVDCPDSIKRLESDNINCQKKNCSTEYDPICGTDGITYTNLCNFQQKICNNKNGPKIEIEYHGACCEEKCSAIDYSPVCDSQNVTHLNICEFGKERCLAMRKGKQKTMTIISYNACEQIPCNINCPAIYEPVCASTGETFSSECELARAVCILNNAGETMLSVDYPGICCQKEVCDLSFEPLCDSQGRTHVNECVFRQEACLSEKKNGLNITIEHKGECCSRFCDNVNDNQPICDTNGRTHASLCEFQMQKCEAEKAGVLLNVAYSGECCPLPIEKCTNLTAVCDSDGMSHKNMCEYEYKKCVIERTQPKLLSIIHVGQCCLLDKCIDENKPVCDSRGVTHLSLCHFNNSKCVYEKVHGKNNGNFSLSYKDKCCELDCNNYLEPVCDQNGDVYRNKCIFEHHLCELSKREPDKEKLYIIPCKKRVTA